MANRESQTFRAQALTVNMEPEQARTIVVKMAQMAVVKSVPGHPVFLKTTLGSCVGVILTDRKTGISGMAHIMLPEKSANDQVAGKYVDSAVPEMFARMAEQGAESGVEAFVLGGACMFHSEGGVAFTDIGKRNLEAARKTIRSLKIPIKFEDTGGTQGRTVIFDCQSAEVTVRTLQKMEMPPKDRKSE